MLQQQLKEEEAVGRYLCKIYYTGELKCSAAYERELRLGHGPRDAGAGMVALARCVEKPLEDAKGRRGKIAETWRKLMSGDLAELNQAYRSRVLGGRAERGARGSIDGGLLCVFEVALYREVGREFTRLLS